MVFIGKAIVGLMKVIGILITNVNMILKCKSRLKVMYLTIEPKAIKSPTVQWFILQNCCLY